MIRSADLIEDWCLKMLSLKLARCSLPNQILESGICDNNKCVSHVELMTINKRQWLDFTVQKNLGSFEMRLKSLLDCLIIQPLDRWAKTRTNKYLVQHGYFYHDGTRSELNMLTPVLAPTLLWTLYGHILNVFSIVHLLI